MIGCLGCARARAPGLSAGGVIVEPRERRGGAPRCSSGMAASRSQELVGRRTGVAPLRLRRWRRLATTPRLPLEPRRARRGADPARLALHPCRTPRCRAAATGLRSRSPRSQTVLAAVRCDGGLQPAPRRRPGSRRRRTWRVGLIRAAAALPLTGRYRPMAMDAARGLARVGSATGARLTIEDCGDDPAEARGAACALAPCRRVDVLFGPYGSGAMRAVAEALAGTPWSSSGITAALPRTARRRTDRRRARPPPIATGPGLADVLVGRGAARPGRDPARRPGFGQAVARGATASLATPVATPLMVAAFDAGPRRRRAAAARCRRCGGDHRVRPVRGRHRARRRRCAGRRLAVGLVACGVRRRGHIAGRRDRGAGLARANGWPKMRAAARGARGRARTIPAAQAYACGLVAAARHRAAGTTIRRGVGCRPCRSRTTTFLGPFAVDDDGRQVGAQAADRPLGSRARRARRGRSSGDRRPDGRE